MLSALDGGSGAPAWAARQAGALALCSPSPTAALEAAAHSRRHKHIGEQRAETAQQAPAICKQLKGYLGQDNQIRLPGVCVSFLSTNHKSFSLSSYCCPSCGEGRLKAGRIFLPDSLLQQRGGGMYVPHEPHSNFNVVIPERGSLPALLQESDSLSTFLSHLPSQCNAHQGMSVSAGTLTLLPLESRRSHSGMTGSILWNCTIKTCVMVDDMCQFGSGTGVQSVQHYSGCFCESVLG